MQRLVFFGYTEQGQPEIRATNGEIPEDGFVCWSSNTGKTTPEGTLAAQPTLVLPSENRNFFIVHPANTNAYKEHYPLECDHWCAMVAKGLKWIAYDEKISKVENPTFNGSLGNVDFTFVPFKKDL